MRRRRAVVRIAIAGLAGHATMLRAQPAQATVHRIGVLMFGTAPAGASPDPNAGFLQGLRELGHAEGRTLVLEAGARTLGLQLQLHEVSGPGDFEQAFKRASQGRAQAVYAIATNTIVAHRARLADLSIGYRLPSISDFLLLAESAFMMSYGADLAALGRRAATYVDKILKGARPGHLPIEQPTDFELVINRKTASALGVTLPQAVLLRANRVIG